MRGVGGDGHEHVSAVGESRHRAGDLDAVDGQRGGETVRMIVRGLHQDGRRGGEARRRLQILPVCQNAEHRRDDVGGDVHGDGRMRVTGDGGGDGVVAVVQRETVDPEGAGRAGGDVGTVDGDMRAERRRKHLTGDRDGGVVGDHAVARRGEHQSGTVVVAGDFAVHRRAVAGGIDSGDENRVRTEIERNRGGKGAVRGERCRDAADSDLHRAAGGRALDVDRCGVERDVAGRVGDGEHRRRLVDGERGRGVALMAEGVAGVRHDRVRAFGGDYRSARERGRVERGRDRGAGLVRADNRRDVAVV